MEFLWQVVSWLIASAAGGLIAAFIYGRSFGRWQGRIEKEIESASRSRDYLREEIKAIQQRLAVGDTKFQEQITDVAVQASRLSDVADNLRGFEGALRQFVPVTLCQKEHQAIDRRLAALEGEAPKAKRGG